MSDTEASSFADFLADTASAVSDAVSSFAETLGFGGEDEPAPEPAAEAPAPQPSAPVARSVAQEEAADPLAGQVLAPGFIEAEQARVADEPGFIDRTEQFLLDQLDEQDPE